MTKYITWTIEIVEAPDSYARASIHEASTISNHHAILESLRAKGKSVVTMQGEAKSGQCISAFHGIKSNDPVEYSIDDKRRSGFKLEPQTWGTLFELEPTLAANNRIVDVNFALTHCHKPGVARREPIAEDSTEKIEVQWIDHPIAMMKSAISMLDGTTQLLGAWALEGETDPARIGLVRAAFLRTHVIKLLPLEEPRVEQILRDNGERFSLTPEVVQRLADPILPNGMETRRFRVPPDFLSLGADPLPLTDPFLASAAARDRLSNQRMNVDEILRSQGISFPSGSSAHLHRATSELVVRNTPENLELISAFVDLGCDDRPKNIALSMHIVQGSAEFVRKLERETMRLPDHSVAWKSIEESVNQGTVKFIRSATLTTKSGQAASTESVTQYIVSAGFRQSGNDSIAENSKPEKDASTPGPMAKASVSSNTDTGRWSTNAEPQPVGLRFEIEPTLGADGWLLDLNLAVNYDFAPPIQRVTSDPVPEGTRRLAAPSTEFRKFETNIFTTLRTGSTRMISVWKPSGTPELDGDVLQALFIRAYIVPVEPTEK